MENEKIFITGGGGYVGASLVPKLLDLGYKVTVLDLFIYGKDVIDEHKNLRLVTGDIRDQNLLERELLDHDVVIHLACISNDPSFELNPLLGRSINLDAFEPLVQISKKSGVQKFIYASSSSVYGIKTEQDVTEDMTLEPLTDYSRFKADCEQILLKYDAKDFTTCIIRPATVCGYSRRQRLDVVVNIFTNIAYHNREISVFGGNQLRPNIHILDMVNVYLKVLKTEDDLIRGQIFNAGDTNYTVLELAEMTKSIIGEDVSLKVTESNDNRSYHVSSKKIGDKIGFRLENSIKKAISDLKQAIDKQYLVDSLNNPKYFNIKMMQQIDLK